MRLRQTVKTGMVLLSVVGAVSLGRAEDASRVVARVGERSVSLTDLGARLGELAEFQARALGKTEPARGRSFLDQVLISELLLAEQARRQKLDESPRIKARKSALLRDLFVAQLERRTRAETTISDESVRRYYDEHPELFVQPKRIRLQRLLASSLPEAEALLEKARKSTDVYEWRNLVREKSLDKATSERSGELGFVAADGSTDVPELEVSRALFEAADRVKDGQFVPAPVAEGQRYAVVWRKGSRPERTVDFAREAPRIREYLMQLKVAERLEATVSELRKAQLKDYRPGPAEFTDLSAIFEGGFSRPKP